MPNVALLLLNPGARKVDDQSVEVADQLRERGLQVVFEPLTDATRAGDIIRRHAADVDRVIIGSGDGTLGAATQALIDTGLPLGILPFGTANNIARTLGIPTDVDAALAIASGNSTRHIDVGRVNGRCFLTTASFGLSVAITEELTSDAKAQWGQRICTRTGGMLETRSVQVVVGNGRYYGTALQVAGDAAIDDHALDLYSIEVQHWWRLLALGPALKRGTHGKSDTVHTARARAFEIVTSTPCPIDADGELIGETPAKFDMLPDALAVFVPE